MASQNSGTSESFMSTFMKTQKRVSSLSHSPCCSRLDRRVVTDDDSYSQTFEINPKHPLIEGLLEKVEELSSGDDLAESELRETVMVLWSVSSRLFRSCARRRRMPN